MNKLFCDKQDPYGYKTGKTSYEDGKSGFSVVN